MPHAEADDKCTKTGSKHPGICGLKVVQVLHIKDRLIYRYSDMPTFPLLHLAEAVVFTLGCAVIQAHRDNAERLTGALAVMALMGFLALLFLITPLEQLNAAAQAVAMADMGEFLPAARQ